MLLDKAYNRSTFARRVARIRYAILVHAHMQLDCNRALGTPQVYPRYGDVTHSWAQGNMPSDEWMEVLPGH